MKLFIIKVAGVIIACLWSDSGYHAGKKVEQYCKRQTGRLVIKEVLVDPPSPSH